MMRHILFGAIVFLLLLSKEAYAFMDKNFHVRPVNLRIIDKTSGEPIAGIPIYYVLRTCWADRVLLIFPNPEGTSTRNYIAIEKKSSDSYGEVYFQGRDVKLSRWKSEEMYDEEIFINLDVKTPISDDMEDRMTILEAVFLGSKYYYNPVSKYKGFFIRSSTWELDPEKKGKTKYEIYDALWNGKGLLKKEPETFVVELERWDSQENNPYK